MNKWSHVFAKAYNYVGSTVHAQRMKIHLLQSGFSKRCSSTQNGQFKKVCAVQAKNRCSSQAHYEVMQGCKKVNSSRNGRFRYELVVEMQP